MLQCRQLVKDGVFTLCNTAGAKDSSMGHQTDREYEYSVHVAAARHRLYRISRVESRLVVGLAQGPWSVQWTVDVPAYLVSSIKVSCS